MHPQEEATFPLSHNLENDKVVLHCFACGYKNIAGQTLYDNLISHIKAEMSEPEKMEADQK